MEPLSRTKRVVYSTIAGLGLFAGAAGVAAAAGRQPSAPNPTEPPAASAGAAGETNDGAEAPDANYRSSVTLPEKPGDPELSDAEELTQLQSLAKVSPADAEAAATAAVPGTAKPAELENEDGNVVYDVEVTGADGKVTEVIVDAGNGKVLHQEAEEADDHQDGDHEDGERSDSGSGASETTTAPAGAGN